MILQNKIPPIYHSIFPELLDIDFPEELISTCDTCTLCRSSQSPYINTKCCSYHPHLANFLVGGIFTDDNASLTLGRERVREKIKDRAGITPYGIMPSIPYTHMQKKMESQEFWSRPLELINSQLCPYYDNGNCTVWKYRENLCVTYFCSSIGGRAGKLFWKKVNSYLKMAETVLVQYAMLQLGWPPAQIKTDTVDPADFNCEDEHGIVNHANYSKLWGDWVDREEEFYKKCFGIVSSMDPLVFKKITGLNREILETAIRDTQEDFKLNILPDYLLLHRDVISNKSNEGYTLLVLGEKSIEVPSVLLPLIYSFNGSRKTIEVFQSGYKILFNMSKLVDELREKGILIKV